MALKKAVREAEIGKLVDALEYAEGMAYFHRNDPDTGTCNLDYTLLVADGWSEGDMQEVAERSGFRIYKEGKGCWSVYGNIYGQANRRTAMVEAITNGLRNRGYTAYTKYVID